VLADKYRTKHPRDIKIGGKITHPLGTMPTSFKVKGLGHMVNNTKHLHFISNYSRIYSHSLGGDTSTITFPQRFIVIRYSLGGDTNNSNTAWVRTLSVQSSYYYYYPVGWPGYWVGCSALL